jgi:hypothetical protein
MMTQILGFPPRSDDGLVILVIMADSQILKGAIARFTPF